MRWISNKKLLQHLDEMQKAGNHVDKRLIEQAKKSGTSFFLFTLEDKESFLSLIWHEIDESRLLTPNGSPRSLRDIAQCMINNRYTFENISINLNLPRNQHDPEWFEKCIHIHNQFEYKRFGWITIVPATDHERQQTPHGTFYIYDGCHKALVLGKLLLCNDIEFKSVEVLLLLPRPK
jgi:hypothetical protein